MGAVEERKLDSAAPGHGVGVRRATGSACTTARRARAVHFHLIGGYRVRRRGGAAGDPVLYCQLGYKWLARLADS